MRKSIAFLIAFTVLFSTTALGITNNQYTQYNKNNSALIADQVNSIEKEADGGLWFSTNGSGAVYIDAAGKMNVFTKEINGIPNNFINASTKDIYGNRFFATNNGVIVYNNAGKWSQYYLNGNKIQAETVLDIAADSKGGVWQSVQFYGLYYRNAQGVMTNYKPINSDVPSTTIVQIEPDTKGGFWFATHPTYEDVGGLAYLSADGKWTNYTTANSKLPSNRIESVFVAKNGAIWAGTAYGFAKLENNNWTVYRNNEIWDYKAIAFAEDSQGNIYVATWGNGLFKITPSGQLTNYTPTNSPVPNNFLNDIKIDAKNNIWIASNYGITQIKQEKQTVSDAPLAPTEIVVFLNGNYIDLGAKPIIKDGRTLVSMRAFLEALGQKVEWNNDERKVISTGDKNIEITIGQNTGYIDGEASPIDVPAEIIDGRTIVPVRWIGEALGYRVQWDQSNFIVYLDKR